MTIYPSVLSLINDFVFASNRKGDIVIITIINF